MTRHWNWMVFKVTSNLNYSMVLIRHICKNLQQSRLSRVKVEPYVPLYMKKT